MHGICGGGPAPLCSSTKEVGSARARFLPPLRGLSAALAAVAAAIAAASSASGRRLAAGGALIGVVGLALGGCVVVAELRVVRILCALVRHDRAAVAHRIVLRVRALARARVRHERRRPAGGLLDRVLELLVGLAVLAGGRDGLRPAAALDRAALVAGAVVVALVALLDVLIPLPPPPSIPSSSSGFSFSGDVMSTPSSY